MAQSSRPLGQRASVENPIPQFSNWVTNLRVVATDDTDKSLIPDNECIILSKNGEVDGSRYAMNTICLLVKPTGASVTLKLYIKEGSDYFLVQSDTVTATKLLTYTNLPPLHYVIEVTGLGGGETVTIHGGGTR